MMTKDDAMARALEAFDRAAADIERRNITNMLVDDLSAVTIDAFLATARENVGATRRDYAAFVAEMLDAPWCTRRRARPG
jgi:hypothetical protein